MMERTKGSQHCLSPRDGHGLGPSMRWVGLGFCNDLRCFVTKSHPRFRCTSSTKSFSVAPIESPRYMGYGIMDTACHCYHRSTHRGFRCFPRYHFRQTLSTKVARLTVQQLQRLPCLQLNKRGIAPLAAKPCVPRRWPFRFFPTIRRCVLDANSADSPID